MIAFFCTIPMSKIIPISATTPSSVPVISNARIAPAPADGNVERMVIG